MCTPELSECWISDVSSNNIVSCSVYCLQSIIRLAYDVPLVSGAPHGHYSLHTYHPGPFSSTIFVYMCSPELSQCWILNVLTQATSKNQTDTHWPPHRQPRTRVRFIDGPDALWAHTCSYNCVTGKFQETMKKHASKCLLMIRCANFDVQHSMPDSPRPKYVKSSLFALSEVQKFPGKY